MSPEKIIELGIQAGIQRDVLTLGRNLELLGYFANLVAQLERERIATSIERLPFGDTTASFAIHVRELKDDTK